MRARLAAAFATRTRDEWSARLRGIGRLRRAGAHVRARRQRIPHAQARGAFVTVGGVAQPAPAPRFSRTPGEVRGAPPERGQGGAPALADWGFDDDAIAELRALGAGFAETGV